MKVGVDDLLGAEAFRFGDVVIDEEKATFSCRDRSVPGGTFTVDYRKIAGHLRRLSEVAIVRKETAPELLDALRYAGEKLDELVAAITYQLDLAQTRLRHERSRVLIDEVPGMIKKGEPNSKEIREALVDMAETVQADEETVNALKAIRAFLQVKSQSVGRAFSAVKAVAMGERVFGYRGSLPAGTGTSPPGCGD